MVTELQIYGITDLQNYGITEGQGKSSIAPIFQSGAMINEGKWVFKVMVISCPWPKFIYI